MTCADFVLNQFCLLSQNGFFSRGGGDFFLGGIWTFVVLCCWQCQWRHPLTMVLRAATYIMKWWGSLHLVNKGYVHCPRGLGPCLGGASHNKWTKLIFKLYRFYCFVLQNILPSEYEYHICSYEENQKGFQTEFRLSVRDEEGAKKWIGAFQNSSKETYRVAVTKPSDGWINTMKVFYSVKPLLEKNYVDLELVTFYWTTLYLSGWSTVKTSNSHFYSEILFIQFSLALL